MAIGLVASGMTSAGAVTLTVSSLPSGSTGVQYQYSSRYDFKYAPVWMANLANANGANNLTGFNQDSKVYFRARAILSTGAYDDWSTVVPAYFPLGTAQVTTPPGIMVSPALIVPPDQCLQWTASNEVAGYPARAMGRDDPGSMWMADMSSNQCWFTMSTSGKAVDTFAVLEGNIPEGMTMTINGGASLANVTGGSPSFTYGPVQARPSVNVPGRRAYHGFVRLPTPQAYPFWRVLLTGVVPSSRFGASYAMCGLAMATKNYATGSKTEQATDLGTFSRGRDGGADRALGVRMRKVSMDLAALSEAQWESYIHLFRSVGLTEPVLVLPNSKSGPFTHDRLLFGTLAEQKSALSAAIAGTESITIDSLI